MNIIQIQDYTIEPNLIAKNIDGVLMIYNKQNGDMYEINDVGGDIFARLQQGLPFEKILNYLVENYDAPREIIQNEMEEFIGRLIELGILII